MSKLKFAILGCGRISFKHVEGIINNREDADLIAVCDLVEDKAIQRKKQYEDTIGKSDIKVYTDYLEMLEREDINVVAIATESGYHATHAINCLNAKKHVIVEKPMALSSSDADEMIKAANINNVKLAVCHQNRFNEPIKMLRKAIDERRFGKIINGTARILWNRNDGYYNQAPWRGTWELDGGTLMNQCIHNIDMLQWMMGGEVDTVYAQTGTFLRKIEAEDFGAIILGFKNGTIGLIEGSACVYPTNLEETLSIFGERGTVVIGGLAVNKIETWKFADEKDREVACDEQKDPDTVYGFGHSPLYKDMLDAIKYDKIPLVDGIEGKKAMQIILAAYMSKRDGKIVKFDETVFSTKEMKNSSI